MWRLPGAGSFASAVEDCSIRYVLTDPMRDACRRIYSDWPDLLDPNNAALRAPMRQLWIEWTPSPGPFMGGRQVGVLVTAAPDGRSGSIRSFWSSDGRVDVAQVLTVFDLDRPLDLYAGAGRLHRVTPEDGLALLKPHLAVAIDECWEPYFAATELGPAGIGVAARLCARQVWDDVAQTFAFCCLLSSPLSLSERRIERARLNRGRAKSGKPALLDHVELTIGNSGASAGAGGAATRSSARLHLVRGHLVRRRQSVFWRSAHLRGRHSDQGVAPKTVSVKVAGGQDLPEPALQVLVSESRRTA